MGIIAMEPATPAPSAKPSKVEAVKLASEYLRTFVADEVDNSARPLQLKRPARSSSSTARTSKTIATSAPS